MIHLFNSLIRVDDECSTCDWGRSQHATLAVCKTLIYWGLQRDRCDLCDPYMRPLAARIGMCLHLNASDNQNFIYCPAVNLVQSRQCSHAFAAPSIERGDYFLFLLFV